MRGRAADGTDKRPKDAGAAWPQPRGAWTNLSVTWTRHDGAWMHCDGAWTHRRAAWTERDGAWTEHGAKWTKKRENWPRYESPWPPGPMHQRAHPPRRVAPGVSSPGGRAEVARGVEPLERKPPHHLSLLSSCRPEGGRKLTDRECLVRPPGGKGEERGLGSQALKRLATIVRPAGRRRLA